MQSIRCYTSYFLNYRDVEELLEERGVALDHATVNRWVVKYSLLLELKFCKHKKKIGSSWRMDETYIKIKGSWVYYYRAVGIRIIRPLTSIYQRNEILKQRVAFSPKP